MNASNLDLLSRSKWDVASARFANIETTGEGQLREVKVEEHSMLLYTEEIK
jgi:hypothetical protein